MQLAGSVYYCLLSETVFKHIGHKEKGAYKLFTLCPDSCNMVLKNKL